MAYETVAGNSKRKNEVGELTPVVSVLIPTMIIQRF
jgi:hypothetical protein